ncbi:UNKNOWN [Stylonychia lemnae]|uniref:TCTP domain-containing protein n=1 Tax=Stylonychia lemnae TaxID=5949 RepID=A0A077ZYN5_STYLE|nr:UNKNOWN [Stylonychia lemnae]|eukprot:CDW75000.1 UNKNOWN [Stylonychia lemnae]
MRVYKDIISGDEMVSDSYPNVLLFEDACLEVKSRLISKNANDDYGIGSNDEEGDGTVDDNSVNVIDIVDSFNLQEITLSKAEWTAYIKTYLPKIKKHLESTGRADRIPVFQKGATALFKHLLEKFDEVQIFAGKGFDVEAGYAYCYYKEQTDAGPTFFYFHDGLREEKF